MPGLFKPTRSEYGSLRDTVPQWGLGQSPHRSFLLSYYKISRGVFQALFAQKTPQALFHFSAKSHHDGLARDGGCFRAQNARTQRHQLCSGFPNQPFGFLRRNAALRTD